MTSATDGSWTGRTALVTGAASGIGLAVSARLAELGARVTMVDLPGPRLEEAAKQVPSATSMEADLSDLGSVHSLDHALARADTLVNNAGLGYFVPISELTDAQWAELLTVMLTAPFMLTRAALPAMVQRGFGRIINVSSVYGLIAGSRRAAYVSAKHGVLGLTKAAAVEAAAGSPHVTVNAVCPSYVRTGALERNLKEMAAERGLSEGQVVSEFLSRNLIKRLIEPVEVAETIAFLGRKDMWSITGQAIVMDAGWLST